MNPCVRRFTVVALKGQLEPGKEVGEGKRCVEVDVVSVVEAVLVTLEVREPTKLPPRIAVVIASVKLEPNGAAVGQEVELVEDGALVPLGEAGVGQHRSLPFANSSDPRIGVCKAVRNYSRGSGKFLE